MQVAVAVVAAPVAAAAAVVVVAAAAAAVQKGLEGTLQNANTFYKSLVKKSHFT